MQFDGDGQTVLNSFGLFEKEINLKSWVELVWINKYANVGRPYKGIFKKLKMHLLILRFKSSQILQTWVVIKNSKILFSIFFLEFQCSLETFSELSWSSFEKESCWNVKQTKYLTIHNTTRHWHIQHKSFRMFKMILLCLLPALLLLVSSFGEKICLVKLT